MVELHMRAWAEFVDPLPLNIQSRVENPRELLDLRPIRGEKSVASHTHVDVRNAGTRTLIHAVVTRITDNLILDMLLVSEGKGLDWIVAPTYELSYRVENGRMSGSEHVLSVTVSFLNGVC